MTALMIMLLPIFSVVAAQQCGSDPGAPTCMGADTCCMDSPNCTGYCTECCVGQATRCVEPRPGFLTSTCCPKWTVGCSVGSVGCCDPARPWQLGKKNVAVADNDLDGDLLERHRRLPAAARVNVASHVLDAVAASVSTPLHATSGNASHNATGYAIFTTAVLSSLVALQFDAGSGAVLSKRAVTGPFAKYYEGYYGEATRILPWDPETRKFYFADVVVSAQAEGEAGVDPISGTAHQKNQNVNAMTIFAIDPTTGGSASQPVTGCGSIGDGYPYGVAWDVGLGRLLVSTQDAKAVQYCAVDPLTGEGKLMGGPLARGTDESSATYYAAYVSQTEGGVAMRVGHKEVTTGGELGALVVTLPKIIGGGSTSSSTSPPAPPPTSTWHAISLGSHGHPYTVRAHPAGGYLSLAPRNPPGMSGVKLDVVRWDHAGASLVANLSDASPPVVPITHMALGYVADAIDASTYAAMTVAPHPSPLLPGVKDKWTVSTVDLASGALVEAPLAPQPSALGAETVSLCAFGVVAPPAVVAGRLS